jgi:hypothetical protein
MSIYVENQKSIESELHTVHSRATPQNPTLILIRLQTISIWICTFQGKFTKKTLNISGLAELKSASFLKPAKR